MAIIVIHGPPASGKTFHAEAFRKHYGCAAISDGYPEGDEGAPRPKTGDLVLTYLTVEQMRSKRYRGAFGDTVILVPIEAARAAIGVGPVQPLSVWRSQ